MKKSIKKYEKNVINRIRDPCLPLGCYAVLSRPVKPCSPPGSSVHRDSPGRNTEVGCHALLQGIFPTQGLNPCLPHCRQILYHLSHQGSPLDGVMESLNLFSFESVSLDTSRKCMAHSEQDNLMSVE